MGFDTDEYNFLCIFFAACRDGMRRHKGFEDLADYYNDLGETIFHKEELTAEILEQIKTALIRSFWLDDSLGDDETVRFIQNLREKALLHTVALLKEAERGE